MNIPSASGPHHLHIVPRGPHSMSRKMTETRRTQNRQAQRRYREYSIGIIHSRSGSNVVEGDRLKLRVQELEQINRSLQENVLDGSMARSLSTTATNSPSNLMRNQANGEEPPYTKGSARIISSSPIIHTGEHETPPGPSDVENFGTNSLESLSPRDDAVGFQSNLHLQDASPDFNIDNFDEYSHLFQQPSIAALDTTTTSPDRTPQQPSKAIEESGYDFGLDENPGNGAALESGTDRTDSTTQGQQSSLVRCEGHISLVTSQNSYTSTPLHLAMQYGQTECIGVLLEHNYDIDAQDHEGRTILFIAAENGDGETLVALLKHGANPAIRDHSGRTPLEVAVVNGKRRVLELLLQSSVRE